VTFYPLVGSHPKSYQFFYFSEISLKTSVSTQIIQPTPKGILTRPTNKKAAVYIRQVVVHQTRLGNDLQELHTELLLKFDHEIGWTDDLIIVFNDSGIPASAPLEKREGLQPTAQRAPLFERKGVPCLGLGWGGKADIVPCVCYNGTMKNEQKTTRMNTRYPADVYEAIQQFAKEDSRSFHSMVIWILREYVKQRQGKRN
jgi:hypothetical protein